jgi:hypothetical protein
MYERFNLHRILKQIEQRRFPGAIVSHNFIRRYRSASNRIVRVLNVIRVSNPRFA